MHFDVFNNDAFSLSQLSLAMTDLSHVPGRIGQLGLFHEEGVATTSISIEKVGNVIRLVPAAQRGAPGLTGTNQKRNLRNLNVVHLPQQDAVIADEIQNLRAFGSETEVETLQNVVNKKLTRMKRDLDVTMEYQRIGAIKGQVLDKDGSVLLSVSSLVPPGAVPTTLVVDKQGRVASRVLGEIQKGTLKALIESAVAE